MTSPDVSIVMPFWNAADTLAAAIDSVLAQSFSDFELILFDDGSTDESLEIARGSAARDGRIRIIQSEHIGIAAGLRRACADARGRYIARMDADDVAYPNRIEKQHALMEANPDVGLCGAQVRMTGGAIGSGRLRYERWLNALATHDGIVRELFVECPIAHPTFFMRRDIYETVGGYLDTEWAEDYDVCMRFWLAGARFAKVGEVLLDWHEHGNRLSMANSRYSPAQFRALKRHYLRKSYLDTRSSRHFYQWGAGEVGKIWLREWETVKPERVVDINPRKIGIQIHGVPVIAPEELPPPGQVFVVIAVGAPGARDEIRQFLDPRGYTECEDYLFVA
jgi:glycosyltransferase involved in cell wall biosynthesis